MTCPLQNFIFKLSLNINKNLVLNIPKNENKSDQSHDREYVLKVLNVKSNFPSQSSKNACKLFQMIFINQLDFNAIKKQLVLR